MHFSKKRSDLNSKGENLTSKLFWFIISNIMLMSDNTNYTME